MALFALTRRAAAVLPCDPSLAYQLLTDYDSYSEWMPFVSASKLLAREGDLAIAEFTLARPRDEKVVVECIHSPNQMVLGRTIGGNIPISRIEWNLAPAAEGRTELKLTLEARPSWRLPSLQRFLNARKLMKAVENHVSAFSIAGDSGDEGEKLLELVETSEGLVVWFRGRKYTLKAASEEH
jgi:ribosome-associated toxin RatA of RatAB toxin-antitoxin module